MTTALARRRRWAPPYTAVVDPSHPLAQALVACHLPVPRLGLMDIAGSAVIPTVGNPPLAASRWGRGLFGSTGTGGNGCILQIGTGHRLCVQPPMTIMFVGHQVGNSAANEGYLYGVTYAAAETSPYRSYSINCGSGGFNNYYFAWNSAGTAQSVNGTTWSWGPKVLFGTISAAGASFWQNGVREGNTGTGVSAINYSSTSMFHFDYYNPSPTDRWSNAIMNMGAIWNRELSNADIARLTGNPFQFLKW